MWEPYAGLRYLQKPVDLIMLNTDEHVLTNPAVRMASQGGSVDWFRFWLQDYEDPDPTKAEQYTRWRELRNCKKQREQVDRASSCLKLTWIRLTERCVDYICRSARYFGRSGRDLLSPPSPAYADMLSSCYHEPADLSDLMPFC